MTTVHELDQPTKEVLAWLLAQKSMSAEQRAKDPHAGPGESFPLDAAHVRSAWDLAGHAADPAKVRAHILAWAERTKNMDKLPYSVQEVAKAAPVDVSKADKTAALLNMCLEHEQQEGDTYQEGQLIQWAQMHGMADALPESAHQTMHKRAMPHDHGDGKESHTHAVMKAAEPTVVSTSEAVCKARPAEVATDLDIVKSWMDADGTVHFEGWQSTPDKDRDKDIVPPECFAGAIDDYAAACMPLSSEHNLKSYPVGHLQKAALVRDGNVFKSAVHPTDPAEFEHFPATGTGVFVRGVITEPSDARTIAKGNVGGMSWVGRLKRYVPLPGGGREYVEVYPWQETTLSAYPINPKAVVVAAEGA